MKKYICSVCGYVYDEGAGIPGAGIAPGTGWEALPEGWVCPLCGASRDEFRLEDAAPAAPGRGAGAAPTGSDARADGPLARTAGLDERAHDLRQLTALEKSALCTNLARGCEKQYKPREAALFEQLAEYFKSIAGPAEGGDLGDLMRLIEGDLESGFARASAAASAAADRGALRALVWSEKVTRILKALLSRFAAAGDAPEGADVYVCTICGFIYVGGDLPELCPVCKVPNWKFEKVEGR